MEQDDTTTCSTVFFPPETCSFYDLMRGNNDILGSGIDEIPCLKFGV